MGEDLRNAPSGWEDEHDQALARLGDTLDDFTRAFDAAAEQTSTGVATLDRAIDRLFAAVDRRGRVLRKPLSHDGYARKMMGRRHYRVTIYPNGRSEFYRDGRRLTSLAPDEVEAFCTIIDDLATRGFSR